MPSRTRKEHRSATIEDAIQKAQDLAASDPATYVEFWEDLCRLYRVTRRDGATFEGFPKWILEKFPHKIIQNMLESVYRSYTKKIECYYPSLGDRFGIPRWQLVLFLGDLPQNKAKVLSDVLKQRPKITFDSLYRELCQIRLKRRPLPEGPLDFTPSDIKACIQYNHLEDDYESNSDVNYQSDDETSHGIVDLSSDEDGNDRGSEANDEDEYEVIVVDSPNSHNSSPEPNSSAKDAASPIDLNSPTSVLNPAVDAPVVRSGATDVEILIASQLGQDHDGQDIEMEVPELGRLLDSEPMADASTAVATSIRMGMQGQNTGTGKTLGQRIVDLANMVGSFPEEHKNLEQEEMATQSNLARTTEDFDTAFQSFQLLLQSTDDFNPEQWDNAEEKFSGLKVLGKKRKTAQTMCQEQQAKRTKFEADVMELHKTAIQHQRVLN